MKPETVLKSEVSQKEKNKYRVLMHMSEIQKSGTDEPICRAGTETQTYGCVDMGWGGEWDGLGGWVFHVYIPLCKTDSQWGPAGPHMELSTGLCGDLQGWGG